MHQDTTTSGPPVIYFSSLSFFFNDTATTEIYPLSLHDALPICGVMRIAPVGMYFAHALSRERHEDRLIPRIFSTGSDLAAITHGHPSGCLSAGVLAVIVGLVLAGSPLKKAMDEIGRAHV